MRTALSKLHPQFDALQQDGASGSFRPTSIGGCTLWLRSDLGVTTVSGAVSAWADQSGQGNNATQGTAGSRPAYNTADAGYNGQPSLQLTAASNHFMTMAALFQAHPSTVFVFGESTSGGTQQQLYGDTGNNVTIFWTGSAWAMHATNSLTSASTVRTPSVFCGVFNGASSAFYINSSSTSAASGDAGTNDPAGTENIGAQTSSSFNLNGKLVEIIIYNSALNVSQRAAVIRYGAARYGMSAV